MIGQFLEFSLIASPLARAFDFYSALGFRPLPAGDQLPNPYVALFDGDIVIGLHDRDGPPTPQLTFVRPQLRDYVRAIRRVDIDIDDRHLADDEFNRLAFSSPDGQAIELIEARTCSPGVWDPSNVSACGTFLEYSLPVDTTGPAQAFWSRLGFEVIAEGEARTRWTRLKGRGLAIGLHEGHFRPGLTFRCEHLEARLEYLRAKGLEPTAGNPLSADKRHSATLAAPEGTMLYLLDAGTQTQD